MMLSQVSHMKSFSTRHQLRLIINLNYGGPCRPKQAPFETFRTVGALTPVVAAQDLRAHRFLNAIRIAATIAFRLRFPRPGERGAI